MFVVFLLWWINRPRGEPHLYTVDITTGMDAESIGAVLKGEGLITSSLAFKYLSLFAGYSSKYKAGKHEIPGTLTMTEIAPILTEKPIVPPDIRVTVIEGMNISEIASLLREEVNVDSTEFVHVAKDSRVARNLGVDNATCEGYLYPDTYYIRNGTAPVEIITRMVSHFHQNFTDSMKVRAESIGMTVNEIVTLASIIETEVGKDEERPLVSSVFHRRLQRGLPLEANPTVQYALGVKRRLVKENLEVCSPYNTYIHRGLPPGPIANPGKKSLISALYPAETNYLYFVANGNGGHVFSQSLDEHNKAVYHYKVMRKNSALH